MWQDVHIQISISFLELSVGPTVYSLKPRLWGPNLELWGWEWALATTAWLDGEVPLNYFWFQWEGWFWCETGLFYSILHPPARIILKIHKSGDTIPFLRTLRWLPTRMKSKVLIKAFTVMGLLPAIPALSPTALPPPTHQPNIFPWTPWTHQIYSHLRPLTLLFHLCGRFISSDLQTSSFLLLRSQCSPRAFRDPLFYPICSSHPPLSSLSSHPCDHFCCFYSTHCSLTEKTMAPHSGTLTWKIP